ncbi:MAG: hypothetical protein JSS41_11375 [Proteobacteria bacterium]|nr:hypothetical protein [Pseudomonadota bacterium]MBS0463741.1 hypothetical protein [Pseudomonadota bacterium]
MTTRHLLLASIVSSAVLLALAGCSKSPSQSAAEAAVAAATGGKVQVSQSGDHTQMTIKDDKGNVMQMNAGGNVALPRDFPSDVHLPANYTLKSVITVAGATVLEMHVAGAMQAVYGEYDGAMKADGWTQAVAMQTSDKESMFNFTKGQRNAVVTITAADGGGSDVHLQVAKGN